MNEEVKILPPKKTWFFEGSNGQIIPAEEKEADSILNVNSGWRRQDLKLIGVSDGTTFTKVVQESKLQIAEKERQLKEKKASLNRYIQGHDKLLFEDFLEEDDPKILRAKAKIEELQTEIEPLEIAFKTFKDTVLKRAEEAELEAARGNIEMPRSFKVIRRGDDIPGMESTINAYTRR